jgi:hypothetical protein
MVIASKGMTIPCVIEGVINDFDELIARSEEEFKNKYHIDFIVNTL